MHYLEKALEEAIKAKNLQHVKNLVKIIRDSKVARLTCSNEYNETLLHATLNANFPEAFDLLFEKLKENKSCLALADSEGNNILHLMAKSGSLEMINKINTQIEASWLGANKQGQTPLHLVANRNPPALLAVLIKHLPKEANAVHTLINFIDNNNDTALSIARKSGIVENMAMLINHDAIIEKSVSDSNESFIASIRKNSDLVFNLFRQLDEKKIKYFVDAWRHLVINHPEDENIKAIYFNLASMPSLKGLLQAHFEFNNKVFSLYSENKDEVIPDVILSADFMPASFSERLIHFDNAEAIDKALKQDIDTLNQLCQQIDTQISDLESEKQSEKRIASLKVKVLRGSMLVFGLLLFLNGFVSFIIGSISVEQSHSIILMLAVFVGCPIGCLSGCLSALDFERLIKPRTISLDGSFPLQKNIEANILSHLQDLEKNNIASLPVSRNQIRVLENAVSQLADPKDRDVDDEVSLLTNLKGELEKMVAELSSSGKPITQVVEDVIIEEAVLEENDEVIIDMPGSSPTLVSRSRYGTFSTVANQQRPLLLDDSSDDEYARVC